MGRWEGFGGDHGSLAREKRGWSPVDQTQRWGGVTRHGGGDGPTNQEFASVGGGW